MDVPSDRIASPGADKPTTVAELSPVNGAIMHSAKCIDKTALFRTRKALRWTNQD